MDWWLGQRSREARARLLLSDALKTKGGAQDFAAARMEAERSLQLRRELVLAKPVMAIDSSEALRDVSVSLIRLGNISWERKAGAEFGRGNRKVDEGVWRVNLL